MTITYIYFAFSFQRMDTHTLYIILNDEDSSVYQMYFEHDLECSNFQRILNDLALEMETEEMDIQNQKNYVERLIESNPLYYEYHFIWSKMSS